MSHGLLVETPLRVERIGLKRVAHVASEFAARLDASPARAFSCLTLLYFLVVLSLSHFKLLWVDELITLHIARLGSIGAIWHALAAGADPNPPVTHILVHLSRELFGENEFALRLPAVIGYWVGMLALFACLRRRVPTTWALGGTLLSMSMAAFDYSYESRSYAIFYGMAMVAFFCWSRCVDPEQTPRQQRMALVGMVLALAIGVSTNYFAVLAFLPIAAGELARAVRRMYEMGRRDGGLGVAADMPTIRSIDLRVWIGLVLGSIPLLAFRHMIAHSIAQFAPYAWNKVSWQQVTDSYEQMVEVVLYPIIVLIAAGLVFRFLARLCPMCRANLRPRWTGRVATRVRLGDSSLPMYEAVGVFFLMAYPILGYIVASIRGGMLSPRFVIPVCFGFAIAGTLSAIRLAGNSPRAGAAFLCLCLAWFLTREAVVGYWYSEQKECFYKVLAHLPEAEIAGHPNALIAVPDPLLALTFQHYAPPAVAAREVFPVDFPAIRRLRGDDSAEENIWAGRNSIYTLPVATLADFERTAGDYLILASDGNWMVSDLREHHYPVKRLDINTRAGAIGGFTPLCHGVPVFFSASGDAASNYIESVDDVPVPFESADNMPQIHTATKAVQER